MQSKYKKEVCHWFVSSIANWTTDADLEKALKRQRVVDKRVQALKISSCVVWRVPGNADREYEIDEYRPLVEDAEYVGTRIY